LKPESPPPDEENKRERENENLSCNNLEIYVNVGKRLKKVEELPAKGS
jgi:hypothetical protein